MATKKPTLGTYSVMAKLQVTVGRDIEATSLQDAVERANALKVSDFIDFTASGLDHNDSESPDVYGVFKNE